MNQFYLTIRKITIAPVMATVMLIAVMSFAPEVFQSSSAFVLALLFLGLLPALAYPMQKHIPAYKERGREGQRNLAIIFAVAGYILGIISGALTHVPKDTMMIYQEYLLSGILIFVFNRYFHIKISGHACGIVAPIVLLAHFGLYACSLTGVAIAILVYLSSLKTKRHTLLQLIGGSVVPLVAYLLIYL